MFDFIAQIDTGAAGLGVLITGLLLGIRHGIDWDHIAAITDITSTTAAASAAEAAHAQEHRAAAAAHEHGHGGMTELQAHGGAPASGERPGPGRTTPGACRRGRGRVGAGAGVAGAGIASATLASRWVRPEQVEAIRLGTLYAVGHGIVVIVLGIAALTFGALLPDWLDPIMGRVVGLTLLGLGDLGPVFGLPVRARRGRVPAAQPLDARVRWRPIRLAPAAGPAPRPRARRTARDELVRHAHRPRRRHDPRHRRRDRDAGPADRRRSAARRAPAWVCRCCWRSSSGC